MYTFSSYNEMDLFKGFKPNLTDKTTFNNNKYITL